MQKLLSGVLILTIATIAAAAEKHLTWRKDLEAEFSQLVNRSGNDRIDTRVDCGARVLTALMLLYDKPVDFNSIEQSLTQSSDGASLAHVAETARNLGLHTAAVSMNPDQLLKLRYPAILHIKSLPSLEEGDHFVLYAGLDANGKVRLIDPTMFDRRLTTEGLKKIWAGATLIVADAPISSESILQSSGGKGWLMLSSAAAIAAWTAAGMLISLRRSRRRIPAMPAKTACA